ncbi:MAG: hypothetical protein Kow0090_00140 [Myxococcota bacterium]
MKSNIWLALFGIFVAIGASSNCGSCCGDDDDGKPASDDDAGPKDVGDDDDDETACYKELMDSSGGVFKDTVHNVTIDIEAGALSGTTEIEVCDAPSARKLGDFTAVGKVFRFLPEGLVFNKPVEVTIPYLKKEIPEGKSAKNIVIYTASGDETEWTYFKDSTADDKNETVASKSVLHFSDFVAGILDKETGDGKTCEIITPTPGSEITPQDDADATMEGIQLNFTVSCQNIEDGATVRLKINGEYIESEESLIFGKATFKNVTVTGDEDGKFTALAEVETADGEIIESELAEYTLKIGFCSPEIVSPADGSYLGLKNDEDPLSPDLQATVTLVSDCPEGATVELKVGTRPFETTIKADGSAKKQLTFIGGDGVERKVTGTVSDGEGNVVEIREVTYIVDTVAPSDLAISYPTDGSTLTAANSEETITGGVKITVSGTVKGVESEEYLSLIIDEGSLEEATIDVATSYVEEAFTFTGVELLDGNHTLKVIAFDKAENETTVEISVSVDSTISPYARFISPVDGQLLGIAADEELAVTGMQFSVKIKGENLPNDSLLDILMDGDPILTGVALSGNKTTQVKANLGDEEGEFTLSIKISSGTKTFNGESIDIAIDTTPPIIAFENLPTKAINVKAYDLKVNAAGNDGGNVLLTVNTSEYSLTGSGSLTFEDIALVEGNNTVKACTSDAALNVACTAEETITVDTIPPTVTLQTFPVNTCLALPDTPITETTITRDVTITANADVEVGANIELWLNGALFSTKPATEVNPTTRQAIFTGVTFEGVVTVQAKARDAVGNLGESAVRTITADNTRPTVVWSANTPTGNDITFDTGAPTVIDVELTMSDTNGLIEGQPCYLTLGQTEKTANTNATGKAAFTAVTVCANETGCQNNFTFYCKNINKAECANVYNRSQTGNKTITATQQGPDNTPPTITFKARLGNNVSGDGIGGTMSTLSDNAKIYIADSDIDDDAGTGGLQYLIEIYADDDRSEIKTGTGAATLKIYDTTDTTPVTLVNTTLTVVTSGSKQGKATYTINDQAWFRYGRTYKFEATMSDVENNTATKTVSGVKTIEPGRYIATLSITSTYKVFREQNPGVGDYELIPFTVTCQNTDGTGAPDPDPNNLADNTEIVIEEGDKDGNWATFHTIVVTAPKQISHDFDKAATTTGTHFYRAKCYAPAPNDLATDSGWTGSVRATTITKEPTVTITTPAGDVDNWNSSTIDVYFSLGNSETDEFDWVVCTTADVGNPQGTICETGEQQLGSGTSPKSPPTAFLLAARLRQGEQFIYVYSKVVDDNPAKKVKSAGRRIFVDSNAPSVVSLTLTIVASDASNDNVPAKGTSNMWGMNKAEFDSGYTITAELSDGANTDKLNGNTAALYIGGVFTASVAVVWDGDKATATYNNPALKQGNNNTFRIEICDDANNCLLRTDSQPGLTGPPTTGTDRGIVVDTTLPTVSLISSLNSVGYWDGAKYWWNASHLTGVGGGLYRFSLTSNEFAADANGASGSQLKFYRNGTTGICTDGDATSWTGTKSVSGQEIVGVNSSQAPIGPDSTDAAPTQTYCVEITEPLGNKAISNPDPGGVVTGRLIGTPPAGSVQAPTAGSYDIAVDDVDPITPGLQLATSLQNVTGCFEFACDMWFLSTGDAVLSSLDDHKTLATPDDVDFGNVTYYISGAQTVRGKILDAAGNQSYTSGVNITVDLQGAPQIVTYYWNGFSRTELLLGGCGAACDFGESRDKNPANSQMDSDLIVRTDVEFPLSITVSIPGGGNTTVNNPVMVSCDTTFWCYTFADFNLGGDGYDRQLTVTVDAGGGDVTTYQYLLDIRRKAPCWVSLVRPGSEQLTGQCSNKTLATDLYFTREDTVHTGNYLKLAGGNTFQFKADFANGLTASLSTDPSGGVYSGGTDAMELFGGNTYLADFTELVLKHQPAGAAMTLIATLDDNVNPAVTVKVVTHIDVYPPSAVDTLKVCASYNEGGTNCSTHCTSRLCSRREGTTVAYFTAVADDDMLGATGKVGKYELRFIRKSEISGGNQSCDVLNSAKFETEDSTNPRRIPAQNYTSGIQNPSSVQVLQVQPSVSPPEAKLFTGVEYCAAVRGADEKPGWSKYNVGETENSANWVNFTPEWKNATKSIAGNNMTIGAGAAGGEGVFINGDAYQDWVVGAPRYPDGTFKGKVLVYFGNPNPASITTVELQANQNNEYFGADVAVGRFIGDYASSRWDIVVASYNAETSKGAIYLYDGDTIGGTPDVRKIIGPAGAFFFGYSVAAGGMSLDAKDAKEDIVVGNTYYPSAGDAKGRVWFIPSDSPFFAGVQPVAKAVNSTDVVPNADSWYFTGTEANAQVGYSVDIGADVDNDDKGDLLVGAPLYVEGPSTLGRAYLLRGSVIQARKAESPGAPLDITPASEGVVTIPTPPATNAGYFGRDVAFVGDINNDGYDDFAIATRTSGAANPSKVVVYQGRAAAVWDANPTLATTRGITGYSAIIPVIAQGTRYLVISPAGDLNNDGFDDILVGVDADGIDVPAPMVVIIYGTGETDNIGGDDIISENYLKRSLAKITLTGGLVGGTFPTPRPLAIGNLLSDGSSWDTSYPDWVAGDLNNKVYIFY